VLVGSFAVGLLGAAGCSSDGTVSVENNGAAAVTVAFGEDDLGKVEPRGGAVVNTDDCLRGPIVVTFGSGRVVTLAESACPGQRLLVRDETAELLAQNAE
jgi:hypothetical protein